METVVTSNPEGDLYYARDRSSIYPHVESGQHRILDLGCGAGIVGKRLKELGRAKHVIGVEIFKPVADQAAKYYEQVFQGDIEAMDLNFPEPFDYVICADILEHLRNPDKIVGRIFDWLRPGGKLISSVPNIRNWRILADLLFKGRWEYEDSGILDRTHLRFFTEDTCRKMLTSQGLVVELTQMLIYGTKKKFLSRVSGHTLDGLLATQVLAVSRKPDSQTSGR